jgi:hypothetical protein
MFGFKISDFIVLRPLVQQFLHYDIPRRPMGDEPFDSGNKNILVGLVVGGVATILATLFYR